MSATDFRHAIDILHEVTTGKIEAMGILFSLARDNPDALIQAARGSRSWVEPIMEAMRHDNRIGAIKALRTEKGLDLKAAKDIIDAAATALNAGHSDTARDIISRA